MTTKRPDRLVTLDFETAYDKKEYSLSKMTTEQYINDPRFEVIGVSLAIGDAPPRWADARHEDIARMLRADDKEMWSNCMLLCQNTMFDAKILALRYGIFPGMLLDTLSMARALHPTKRHSLSALAEQFGVGVKGTEVNDANGMWLKDFSDEQLAQYGEYCKNDVELTRSIFYKMVDVFPASELALIDITLRMYTQPSLMLNRDLVQQELDTEIKRKADLIEMAQAENGEVFRSNPKFAELLKTLGVDPPTKLSAKQKNPDGTAKRVWAFAKNDADFSALQEHEDPVVVAAVEARLGCKSTQRETRAQRFLGIHDRNAGVLPVPLAYYAAHTGRYGGCVIADTKILCYSSSGVIEKRIVDVSDFDLVWDGEEFVEHGGVVYSGYQEVIRHDGVTATPEHMVFIEDGRAESIHSAKSAGNRILVSVSPSKDALDAAAVRFAGIEGVGASAVPVWDEEHDPRI